MFNEISIRPDYGNADEVFDAIDYDIFVRKDSIKLLEEHAVEMNASDMDGWYTVRCLTPFGFRWWTVYAHAGEFFTYVRAYAFVKIYTYPTIRAVPITKFITHPLPQHLIDEARKKACQPIYRVGEEPTTFPAESMRDSSTYSTGENAEQELGSPQIPSVLFYALEADVARRFYDGATAMFARRPDGRRLGDPIPDEKKDRRKGYSGKPRDVGYIKNDTPIVDKPKALSAAIKAKLQRRRAIAKKARKVGNREGHKCRI